MNNPDQDSKTDAEKMPPPTQPTKVDENSFNKSVGMLRRHKRRKKQNEHNKTFVFNQLHALERTNKNIVAVFAKIRSYNTKLEQENYEFKQKQVAFLVKNASINRQLRDLKMEREKLTRQLERKDDLITQAISLQKRLVNITNAIESDQNGIKTNSSYSELQGSFPEERSKLENDTGNINSVFKSRLNSVTQRARRVPKRNIDENNAIVLHTENDERSISINAASSDSRSTKNMPALSEKEEPLSDENEITDSTFEDVFNECTDDLNLNISEESEPVNMSVSSAQNGEKEIVQSSSSSSIINTSEIEVNCRETNQSCDVMIVENGDTNSRTHCDVTNLSSDVIIDSNSNDNTCKTDNSSSETNVLSDSFNTKHQEQQNFSLKSSERQNSKKSMSKCQRKSEFKSKKKFTKSNLDISLNKTSTYDFLSCSSDSFLLDEEKRIKLHDSAILNDENSSPQRRTVRRRGKSAVSYAEPSLRAKLRRGDQISDGSLYNSPKQTFKKRTKNPGKRV